MIISQYLENISIKHLYWLVIFGVCLKVALFHLLSIDNCIVVYQLAMVKLTMQLFNNFLMPEC